MSRLHPVPAIISLFPARLCRPAAAPPLHVSASVCRFNPRPISPIRLSQIGRSLVRGRFENADGTAQASLFLRPDRGHPCSGDVNERARAPLSRAQKNPLHAPPPRRLTQKLPSPPTAKDNQGGNASGISSIVAQPRFRLANRQLSRRSSPLTGCPRRRRGLGVPTRMVLSLSFPRGWVALRNSRMERRRFVTPINAAPCPSQG